MTVAYGVTAGVATLTLDSPENRNALTPSLLNGLGDGLTSAAADGSVRVVVLTNTGPAFCAGADLSGDSSGDVARYGLADVLTMIQSCPKPVVGRIAGHCMGGGVGLAAACDISLVSDSARFGFTEVRIGVAPAIISVVCLPKLRRADALDLFLTGERIPAKRAAEVGLVNRAVADDQLDAEVLALVGRLLAGGPQALAATKSLVFDVPGMEPAAAFAHMTEVSQSLFASVEAAEGMAAFREKRSPSWVP
jgi:methylglutaconyl-CoA hydratase